MTKRWYHYILSDYEIVSRLDRIEQKIDLMNRREIVEMSVQQDIKDALDKVTADVAAETTLTGSVLVFIKGLQDQILALANATPDTTTAQALQALATQIEVNNKTTADAMVANTPAPPPTTDPVPRPAPSV